MNDHETVIVEKKREELIKEHRGLEEKLFKRMPLRDKIHSYVFAITFVGAILFGIWLVGYIVYALIFKSPR